MKHILLALSIALIIFSCANQSGKDENTSISNKRPNIVFIMTDDHAFQAISAYGSQLIETPNIDRLANEGMRFDKAFVTNSICGPSRAVILTGKFSHINGFVDNHTHFNSGQPTYPKMLQAAGYKTALYGKWHLGSNPEGFDDWKVLPGQGFYYNPEFFVPNGNGGSKKDTVFGYVTDIITDLAIGWLDTIKDGENPFMLMYQHKAPHREWFPSPERINEFKGTKVPEPETLFDNYEGRGTAAKDAEMRIRDHMGLSNDSKITPARLRDMNLIEGEHEAWYPRAAKVNYERMTAEQKEIWDAVYEPINEDFVANTPEGEELVKWKYQRYMEDYLGTVKAVDDNIGRFLDYLDSTGLSENTMVIYTSDQGFYLGEHGWFDKRFMYEESFRTPLLIRWPNVIEPGTVNTDLVQNLDFAETMLDAAGVEIPDDMQGKSLLPLFTGDNADWRDAVYYHYYEYPGIHAVKRHHGVRTKNHKLIHFYYDIDEWELYDLEKDPQEMTNVYGQSEYAEIQIQLHTRLEELRAEYGDSDSLQQVFIEQSVGHAKEMDKERKTVGSKF